MLGRKIQIKIKFKMAENSQSPRTEEDFEKRLETVH